MNDPKAFKSSRDLVDDFENLVQQVFTRADANGKANFLHEFENFKTTCRKVPIVDLENGFSSKKLKLEKEVQMPNEIWMKIMTYLPSKDFFGSFALVNTHFHRLTLDPSTLKYLQIGDIKHDFHLKCLMKVVERSKKLKEVEVVAGKKSVEYWNIIVSKTLEINENLESLKISSVSNDQVPYYMKDENNPMYSLSSKIMDVLEQRKNLKVLQLKRLIIKPDIGYRISEMRHLRSLHLSYDSNMMISPNIVSYIAKNLNQLEDIEIFTGESPYDGNGIGFRRAFNNLFENNCKTLKKISIRVRPFYCKGLKKIGQDLQCLTIQSLALCQNLEEFNGPVHAHDLKLISKFITLKKLELNDVYSYNLKVILSDGMNFPHLKYLSIKTGGGETYDTRRIIAHISKQFLPELERLYISSRKRLFNNRQLDFATLEKMLKNFPKLKSLQIDGNSVTAIDVPNDNLYTIFRDFGIFIIFGKVKEMPYRQKYFENFLKHDPLILDKYYKEKHDFSKWCGNNVGYGY